MRSAGESDRSAHASWFIALGTAATFAGGVMSGHCGFGVQPNLRGAALGLAIFLVGISLFIVGRWRGGRVSEPLAFLVASVAIALPFATHADERTFFYVTQGALRGTHLWFALGGWIVARWLLVAPDRRAPWLLAALQLGLTVAFFDSSNGAIPVRDDHPAFLYRFFLLSETFPRVVFYNPQWNAGYLATEIIATGAHLPFLLAAPLFAVASVEHVFAAAIPYFFVFVLPWTVFAALRAFGVRAAGAALGGIVAIAPTSVLFIYELVYGVYPFVLACGFAVLAAGLFDRLFVSRVGTIATGISLVLAATCCLVWLMGVVILFPVVPFALALAVRFRKREWAFALTITFVLVAINLPWVLELHRRTDVAHFVVEQESPIAKHTSIAEVAWNLGSTAQRVFVEAHPLVWVYAPIGLALLARGRRTTASLLAGLIVWNGAAAVIGPGVKEDIALERFPIPFALFVLVPAAVALDRLARGAPSLWRQASLAIAIGTILLGAASAGEFLRNRGRYHYTVLPEDIARTISTVRERCHEDRRVLIPGYSLHWFGRGHIAALPMLADRSFVGNDFYHRVDRRDVVPPAYRSPERFDEFLDLYDVGCVLSWNPQWSRMLDAQPSLQRIHDERWLKLYARPGPAVPFFRGSGRVTERIGSLLVESSDDDVVIRYRWIDGLASSPPVAIAPYPIDDELSFIRLRMSGASRIELRYR